MTVPRKTMLRPNTTSPGRSAITHRDRLTRHGQMVELDHVRDRLEALYATSEADGLAPAHSGSWRPS